MIELFDATWESSVVLDCHSPAAVRRLLRCVLFVASLISVNESASAQRRIQQAAFIQPQSSATIKIDVAVEAIEARRKAAAELTELDDETKTRVDGHYSKALDTLKKISDARTQSAKEKELTDTAQERAQKLKDRLAVLRDAAPAEPLALPLPELEAELTERTTRLTELKTELSAAQAESAARETRQREILSLLTSASQRRDDLQKQIDAPPPANEKMAVTEARRTELITRRMLIDEEMPALQIEQARYNAEESAQIVTLTLDISTEEVGLAEKELRLLEQAIATKQKLAAEEAVRKARDEAIAAQPLLRPIADENSLLAQAANDLTDPVERTRKTLEETTRRLEEIQQSFADIRQKVKRLGLTGAIGALLRRERNGLPDIHRQKIRVRERRSVIEDEQFKLFQYEDDRTKLANRDASIQSILAAAEQREDDGPASPLTDPQREKLTVAAHDVLDRKAAYLDQLITRYRTYVNALYALDLQEQELIRQTEEFKDYIDERVLWIRSNDTLFSELTVDSHDQWLFSVSQWSEVAELLIDDAGEHLGLFGLTILVAAMLVVVRPRVRKELVSAGDAARKGYCSTITPTVRAVGLTLLLSVLWPSLVLLIGMRLTSLSSASEFGRAVGFGLQSLATVGLSLEILRNVCRARGLADDHFDWPDSTIVVFRKAIPRLMLLSLPIAFLTTTLYYNDTDHKVDLVERICFVLGTVVLTVFLRRILRPDTGVLSEYLARNRGGWLDRLTTVWYWGGVLSPLVLAGMAASGFYYTAYQLAWRLFATILFVVAVQMLRALLQRLLIVQRRQIKLEQLRQRREEAANSENDQPEEESSRTPLASVPLDELRADVESNTEQSRRLLSTALFLTSLVGVWMIWVDVLPALRFLDRWPLWETTVAVTDSDTEIQTGLQGPILDQESPDPSSADDLPKERVQPVTIIHLIAAILIAVLTVAAARNLPGLMELWVLQKLPLDQSVRYAIRALTSYSIVLIGAILSFNAIYIGWEQVQWLATALTFGLAFGLQEIFANFVAGLILLFERPIRVGDVVTVDDVSGVVSRIRIRATTITNWDRKEYVIPNREFITGRMLNWTLSDKVNRIVINVGVAYGSDTEQAQELLLQVCREHPLLLSDPGPIVTFEGFGDNALNFVVRTYLPNLDNRLGTIHDLHTRINTVFEEAGIEIAFPQQDLHIRSVDEDAARGLRGESPAD